MGGLVRIFVGQALWRPVRQKVIPLLAYASYVLFSWAPVHLALSDSVQPLVGPGVDLGLVWLHTVTGIHSQSDQAIPRLIG